VLKSLGKLLAVPFSSERPSLADEQTPCYRITIELGCPFDRITRERLSAFDSNAGFTRQ